MRVILGVLVGLLIFTFLVIPLSILIVIKLAITLTYCLWPFKKRDRRNGHENSFKLSPMSVTDCAVANAPSWERSAVNVGAVLRVEGKVEVVQFREHFAHCFNLHHENEESSDKELEFYSNFCSCIVTRGGYVFRACSRSSLILADHILERRLQTRDNDTESLEDFLVRWMLEDYQEYRPCWEAAVIQLPTNDNSKTPVTAIAFKIHHGLCDGYSLVHIIDKLTETKSPYFVKDFQDGFGKQLKQMLEAPLSLGKMTGAPPERTPFRVDLTNISLENRKYEWLVSFTSFSLEDLKTLRRRHGGVHLTSVIWAVLTGAMRRFLLEEVKMEQEQIPEYIKIANTLPWPRHPAMVSGTRNEEKMCNHWSSGVFKVPLREPDLQLRLQKIEEEYCSFLDLGLDKFVKRVLHPILWTMPGPLMQAALMKDPGLSNALTCMVGGDSYKLFEYPVISIHPLLVMHNDAPLLPLSCFTFSHSGKMELTIGANPLSVIKNQKNLDKICKQFCHDEITNFLRVS